MDEFEKSVMQKIEERGLSPRPYLYFLARRSVFWTLAGLSIFLGAVSLAVAIFAIEDSFQSGGKSLNDMPLDEILLNLPFLWLAVFGLFLLSAFFALRYTRHGYRYHPILIVVLAGLTSAGLGLILHVLDIGSAANRFLDDHFPAYAAYTYVPFDEWRHPDQGKLGGTVLSVIDGHSLILRDFDGRDWTIDITATTIDTKEPLAEEGDITIRGVRTGPAAFSAQVIAAFN